ncbi:MULTISPECIES: hypothetical protein [Acinetobacter]|uniref:Uncharacterized protein n=1 Tax=Acinetobacter beijerinckii ANC 3835 TaxID=1217649 RepID=N9FLN5_9GAMM|nr:MULTISPECIES: hypothetical protein [Acinetobacter]ENW05764.1 hypothetical protein F934_01121 [Acinetobacter beijerinckii ANC 3835]UTO20626.1 hypothetical protein NGC85_05960 [Acinetobacter sp. Z1]
MHLFKLTNEQLAQILIPERFVPEAPAKLKGKNIEYVFDSEHKFDLTYDELLEIIGKARLAGPQLIPVIGTVGE